MVAVFGIVQEAGVVSIVARSYGWGFSFALTCFGRQCHDEAEKNRSRTSLTMSMPIHESVSRAGTPAGSRDARPASVDVSKSDVFHDSISEQSGEPVWELVRRVRKLRGMTQYQLADRLAELSSNSSVSRDEVARWERGKRVPGPYWRQWLSLALDVPSEQLLEAVRYGRLKRAAR